MEKKYYLVNFSNDYYLGDFQGMEIWHGGPPTAKDQDKRSCYVTVESPLFDTHEEVLTFLEKLRKKKILDLLEELKIVTEFNPEYSSPEFTEKENKTKLPENEYFF